MAMRTRLRLAGALVLSAALTVSPAGTATADHRPPAFPDRIELPTGFQPEGITIGQKPIAIWARGPTGTSTPPTWVRGRAG